MASSVRVGILLGSKSDAEAMRGAFDLLKQFGVGAEMRVRSAHRSPKALEEYVRSAPGRGIRVLICAAGKAAHLAGACAAATTLPVLGVPMESTMMGGLDALLSTVQMPPGIPVGTFGTGASGGRNAALFAIAILALSEAKLAKDLRKYRTGLAEEVDRQDRLLQKELRG